MLKKPRYSKKYNVVICGIFRNEAIYLKEWIEYHKLLGFEHIYLYNNFSDDGFESVISPYIESNFITLIDWPYEKGQLSAYRHFHDNYRLNSQWYIFLDIDEFIVPLKDTKIVNWIKRHDKYPVLMIDWKMFGTSGRILQDNDKLIIEQYVNCWPDYYKYGKCFINSDYAINRFDGSVHHCTKVRMDHGLWKYFPIPTANQFGIFIQPYSNITFKRFRKFIIWRKEDIQINHYWSKSFEEYEKKQKRPDVFYGKTPYDFAKFYEYECHNTSVDYSIYRFIVALKNRLNKDDNS